VNAGKAIVLSVWAYCVASFIAPDAVPLSWAGRATSGLMGVAHVIEFFVYRDKLAKAPGSTGQHFARVLLFGYLHVREARQAARASRTA
jgi:uncharacterized protein YhhL (DUF1145 family)